MIPIETFHVHDMTKDGCNWLSEKITNADTNTIVITTFDDNNEYTILFSTKDWVEPYIAAYVMVTDKNYVFNHNEFGVSLNPIILQNIDPETYDKYTSHEFSKKFEDGMVKEEEVSKFIYDLFDTYYLDVDRFEQESTESALSFMTRVISEINFSSSSADIMLIYRS